MELTAGSWNLWGDFLAVKGLTMIAGGWLAANLPVVLIIVLVIWFCVDYDGVWWNWGLADEASLAFNGLG